VSEHSSHRGSSHFWAQRLTAVALVFLGLWFLYSVLSLENLQFDAVSAWMSTPLNSILMLLTFVSLVYHSQLGVQIVIEDYVHGPKIAVLSLRLNVLAHVGLAAAGLYALATIGFGV
jgi:succinate dehydrogenase / fumarate reductase membrane anchor subunit